jgi:hypothetical protein
MTEKQLIDDAFYVEEKKYGLWDSYDKDGKGILTALTEEECVRATRWYLKAKQEGFVETTNAHSGSVDYKL